LKTIDEIEARRILQSNAKKRLDALKRGLKKQHKKIKQPLKVPNIPLPEKGDYLSYVCFAPNTTIRTLGEMLDIVAFDGTFLLTDQGFTMLSAYTLSSNYDAVALGHCFTAYNESEAAWTIFCEFLDKTYGEKLNHASMIAYMDEEKGIAEGLRTKLTQVKSLCDKRHRENNIQKNHGVDTKMRWERVRIAYTKEEYDNSLRELLTTHDENAKVALQNCITDFQYPWELMDVGMKLHGRQTTQFVEVMNEANKNVRGFGSDLYNAIVAMVENEGRRFNNCKNRANELVRKVAPRVFQRVKEVTHRANKLEARICRYEENATGTMISAEAFVKSGPHESLKVVLHINKTSNLVDYDCQCGLPRFNCYPCRHTIAAVKSDKRLCCQFKFPFAKLISKKHHMETYRRQFPKGLYYSIPSSFEVKKCRSNIGSIKSLPERVKKRGRPKGDLDDRIKDVFEPVRKKRKHKRHCYICNEPGHDKRTCKQLRSSRKGSGGIPSKKLKENAAHVENTSKKPNLLLVQKNEDEGTMKSTVKNKSNVDKEVNFKVKNPENTKTILALEGDELIEEQILDDTHGLDDEVLHELRLKRYQRKLNSFTQPGVPWYLFQVVDRSHISKLLDEVQLDLKLKTLQYPVKSALGEIQKSTVQRFMSEGTDGWLDDTGTSFIVRLINYNPGPVFVYDPLNVAVIAKEENQWKTLDSIYLRQAGQYPIGKKGQWFDNESILFPMNLEDYHWILLWFETEINTLFVVDPMQVDSVKEMKVVQDFVKAIQASFNTKRSTEFKVVSLPDTYFNGQKNGFDCGVFVCLYMILIWRRKSLKVFRQRDCNKLRRILLQIGLKGIITNSLFHKL
jgi:hypothetical protein